MAGDPFARGMQGTPWARSTVSPWHMWGSTQTVRLTSRPFAPLQAQQTQQLAKINYKRPDTWTWLLYFRILACDPQPTGAFQAMVTASFDVSFGLGRSVARFQDFAFFSQRWLTLAQNPIQNPLRNPIFATTVQAPGFIQDPATPVNETPPTTVSEMPAQDINCNVVLTPFSEYDNVITVEVGAFFAPRSHVRPDWFTDGVVERQFPGDETGGA